MECHPTPHRTFCDTNYTFHHCIKIRENRDNNEILRVRKLYHRKIKDAKTSHSCGISDVRGAAKTPDP